MKNLLPVLFLLLPFLSPGHPPIGIVGDSRGTIYYTDLAQVWKTTGGKSSVAVPDVHTHELWLDTAGQLYGEGGAYESATGKFYYYLWVLRADGRLDTVVGWREAYIQMDFSLARDRQGNEYYTKAFLKQPDTTRIFKRTPDGKETVLATGAFKDVRWLHPQDDGSVLFVRGHEVYRMSSSGQMARLATVTGGKKPAFSGYSTLWGVWQDASANVYVTVFSDQAVRQIRPDGSVTDYYVSKGRWSPVHGVFDHRGRLWLMECSDKNEIRVIMVARGNVPKKSDFPVLPLVLFGAGMLCMVWLLFRKRRSAASSRPSP